jgi:hypothetical protein
MKKSLTLAVVTACVVGCQSSGTRTAAISPSSSPTNTIANAEPPKSESSGFGLGSALQIIGFQKPSEVTPLPSEVTPPLVRPEIVQLGSLVNTVFTKAQGLSVNDPPEVTRQKAWEILQALGSWDSLLNTVRGTGLVNDQIAMQLNSFVQLLRNETQKLMQYAPTSDQIGAIQQLAGALKSTVGGIGQLVASGAPTVNAILGGSQAVEQR